jgi:hypothetical protein
MPAPKGHPNYDTQGLAGRPKKYDDAFIENEAVELENWIEKPNSVWFEDFANQRGYSPDYLSEWAKKNERFFGAYKRAQALQKSILVRGGLSNKFNAGFTKFVMANTCGWSDRQETKLSGDVANPLAFLMQQIDGKSKDLINGDNEK